MSKASRKCPCSGDIRVRGWQARQNPESTASKAYSANGGQLNEPDAMKIAMTGGAEIDKEIAILESGLALSLHKRKWLGFSLTSFVWLLTGLASMGGLLLGIDQSLISGAGLYIPASLRLSTSQVSVVAWEIPLGAIGGTLMLGSINKPVGRILAIIVSLFLYTAGAALEAGSIGFGMVVSGRVIVDLGCSVKAGTIPVYLAGSSKRKLCGNLVSLCQFNIALGEVFGYVVAAIFVNVETDNWRYILGSSLAFGTAMLVGMPFMPESCCTKATSWTHLPFGNIFADLSNPRAVRNFSSRRLLSWLSSR